MSQIDAGLAGRVIHVTRLDASGEGSLRAALDASGPRLVVFDVGGVIDLGGRSITVRQPNVTIAGQTAPDPGITLIRGSLSVETHDVVVQHIAVRPGDGGRAFPDWTPDALGAHRAGEPVHHVLFENCSATWAVDENLSVSGPADVDGDAGVGTTSHDVTLRHCLIAEALSHSTHPKGEHSKGTLIHDGVRGVTISGCVYASNRERNPRLKGGTTAIVTGNVMYNWGSACVGIGSMGNERKLSGAEAVVTANVAIAGPDTRRAIFVHGLDPGGRVYLRDNFAVDVSGAALPVSDAEVIQLATPPPWATAIETPAPEAAHQPNAAPKAAHQPSAAPEAPDQGSGAPEARHLRSPARERWDDDPTLHRKPRSGDIYSETHTAEQALRRAGSRPARRDPIDARIIQSIITGTGRIIDSQEQVGGYPVRPATRRVLTVPDSPEARRRWLQQLSDELGEDRSLDIAPLWRRLGIASAGGATD